MDNNEAYNYLLTYKNKYEKINEFLDSPFNINKRYEIKQRTLLHYSILWGEYELTLYLVKNKDIDVRIKDCRYNLAIVYLLRNIRDFGFTDYDVQIEIYKIMIDKNIDLETSNEYGKSVREYIIDTKQYILFDIIYDKSLWIYEDFTYAITYDNQYVFYKLLHYFVKNKISLDEINDDYFTPMMISLWSTNTLYCEELCKHGAIIKYTNDIYSPYEIAKREDKKEFIEIMDKYLEQNKDLKKEEIVEENNDLYE